MYSTCISQTSLNVHKSGPKTPFIHSFIRFFINVINFISFINFINFINFIIIFISLINNENYDRDMAQWLERGALSMSLPALRFCAFCAEFSEKYHVSPLSILGSCFHNVSLGKALNPQMFHVTMSTLYDRNCNVYDKFNAPEWLQNCMFPAGLKWHTNEQVEWPGVKM